MVGIGISKTQFFRVRNGSVKLVRLDVVVLKSRNVSSFFLNSFRPQYFRTCNPHSRSILAHEGSANKSGDGRGLRGFAQASVPLLRGETSGGRLTKSRRFVMLRPRDMLRRNSLHSSFSLHELFEARLSPAHASTTKHSGHTRTKPTCSRVCRDPLMHAISVSMSLVSR